MATEILRPDAAGDLTQLSKTGVTYNWEAVDEETPDESTTYNYCSAYYAKTDLYNLPSPVGQDVIEKIIVHTRVGSNTNQHDGYSTALIKTDGSQYSGTQRVVTNTWTSYQDEWALNPKTGVAWTLSDIAGLQIGVYLIGPQWSGTHANCTQEFLEIVFIAALPTAAFSANITNGIAPLEVSFYDLSSGGFEPYTYTWDFGDDTPVSHEENPVHNYQYAGYFTVTLTIQDDHSHEDIEEKPNYIFLRPPEVFVDIDGEIDLTPTVTDSWEDSDCSEHITELATGVCVRVVNEGASEGLWGIRCHGSTDDVKGKIPAGAQAWGYIGVSGQTFQSFVSNTSIKIRVYAYCLFGINFFVNAYDKTPSEAGWKDIDCALVTNDHTAGLIFLVKNTTSDALRSYGLRKKGSTDAYTLGQPGYLNIAASAMQFVMIGCDLDQISQFQLSNVGDLTLHLVGYVCAGMEFLSNAVDKSVAQYEQYVDVDCSSITEEGVAFAVQVNALDKAGRYAGLRYPGKEEDPYHTINYGSYKLQKANADQIFEAKVQDNSFKLFIVGWVIVTPLLPLTICGKVQLGNTPVEDAHVLCYNLTRKSYVGATQTDELGEYTFVDAGHQFEEFLISAHYISPGAQNRYGGCKKLTLEEEG